MALLVTPVGRRPRSAVARGRHAGGAPGRRLVPDLQRPAAAIVDAGGSTRGVISSSISISRSTTRGLRGSAAAVRRAALAAGAERSAVAARARRRVRSARRRRLPIAARRRADGVGRSPARARRSQPPAAAPTTWPAADRSHDSFEQALTIVYRMLFLLFAEARALVPLWHPVYRESYSLEALRDAAEQSPRAAGLWDALRAIARLAHAGCRAGDLRVTPFNGRLFAPARTPLAERRDLDDEAARRAMRRAVDAAGARPRRARAHRLPRPRRRAARRRLRDAARLRAAASDRAATRVRCEPGSGVRKATGTFYTPQPIADYLVRRTLGAARARRDARADPRSCASSIRRWAAARFSSPPAAISPAPTRRRWSGPADAMPSDIGDAERAAHPPDDRGALPVRRRPQPDGGAARAPVAVAGDARRRSAAQLSRSPPAGRRQPARRVARAACGTPPAPPPASTPRRRCRCSTTRPVADALRDGAADPLLARVDAERHARTGAREGARARRADRARRARCRGGSGSRDLWCAAWFAGRRTRAPAGGVRRAVGRDPHRPRRAAGAHGARAISTRPTTIARRAPVLSLGARVSGGVLRRATARRLPTAGFDAVIGNPPWDMIRADAGAADARAARAARHGAGAPLHARRRRLHARSPTATPTAISCSSSGRSRSRARAAASGWCCRPASRPITAARRCGGCCSRAATSTRSSASTTTAASFRSIAASGFLLVTASAGRADRPHRLPARRGRPGGARRRSAKRRPTPPWFPVRLSPALLERISGADLAIPDLRTRDRPRDRRARGVAVSAARQRARAGRRSFGRELNATDDRERLPARPARGLPVVEGKHIEPFRVALDAVARTASAPPTRGVCCDPIATSARGSPTATSPAPPIA